jgi:hypothetical protein
MALPEGWRTIRLSDILPEDAIKKLVPALNAIQRSGERGKAAHERIMAVLAPHRQALLDKGVLPEYLAYVLLERASRGGDLPSLPLN